MFLARLLICAVAAGLMVSEGATPSPPTLIVNASVLDGTGGPPQDVEVRVENGKITAIGRLKRQASDQVVDAAGWTLAPGFIDTHSHQEDGLFEEPDALAAVSQGITTIVAGQDGVSHFPLSALFGRLKANPAAINVASYAGHGTIRSRVMGDDFKRAATDAEVARMRGLVREEMAAGALADRGVIRPGIWADLVLFDPQTIIDHATVRQPHALSTAIKTVWVNGEVVFADGRTTKKTPGHMIKREPGDSTVNREVAIDEFVRAEMARQRAPGAAIGIVHKGRTTAKGYGYANLEQMSPVTDESIFQSGSVGKMITAAAILMAVEEGKLSLSDPLTKFFPDAPASWGSINVRHLLNHTSGIPDYTTSAFDYRKDYSEDELARFAQQLPVEFAAGSRWNYSNTGYALLGFILRKVSGKFYGDVLAERIFTPLGMRTARIISEQDVIPKRAAGYQLIEGELKNQNWVAPELNTTADGSLYWSLRDVLAWNAAVKERRLLRAESWEQMLSPVRLNSGKTYPYGMGWFLTERNGRPLREHGGSWQGFKAQLSQFSADDLDIIVLVNLAQADPMRFVNGIAAILDPALSASPSKPIEDKEPEVTRRIVRLLDTIREGQLGPADFAYVRAGFFPDAANAYRRELLKLGQPGAMQLLERKEQGDDRIYSYQLTFDAGPRYLRVGLAPDDRVSVFSIKQEP